MTPAAAPATAVTTGITPPPLPPLPPVGRLAAGLFDPDAERALVLRDRPLLDALVRALVRFRAVACLPFR
jgi:hypothetical protein